MSIPEHQLLSEVNVAASLLTSPQLSILLRMAKAMQQPLVGSAAPGSDIATPGFFIAFGNELLLYHAVHREKLSKKTFEYLFMYACQADGRRAFLNANTTAAAGDIILDDVSISLKTQADKDIRASKVYIQKFMEARWIRDCRTQLDFAAKASELIPKHVRKYQRILMLRAIRSTVSHHTYELIEIPRELFLRLESLGERDFSPRNTYGSSATNVYDSGGNQLYRLLLDGSVEKVRIFGLVRTACIPHAEWKIPIPPPSSEDDEQQLFQLRPKSSLFSSEQG